MAGVENNPFDKSKLSQKQIDAAKKIMEAYGKSGNINFSNYDISNLSIFIGDLTKWKGNINSSDANVKSLFADFEKLGLENVYNFIDADGKNGISQEEISNFNLLDSDYAEFLPYQMNSSGQYRTASNITEFDFEGLITSASNAANSAGSADTSETNPPTTNPPVTNPPAENPPANNPPATNPPAENPPATSTTEVKPKNADKDGNSYVIVTPWGKKESGKDQNDCLLRIIQNNYNKDIKYGTEEYWTYANAVMEANPQIYDKEYIKKNGLKERKIVGGSKVDSMVIYTGEKVKLPTVEIETKTPPPADPPVDPPVDPPADPPAKDDFSPQYEVKNGVPTIVGYTKTTKVGDNTTTVEYGLNKNLESSTTKDKNGRTTEYLTYDTNGNVATSTITKWSSSDASADASRTQVVKKSDGTYETKTYYKELQKWSEPLPCKNDGTLSGYTQKTIDGGRTTEIRDSEGNLVREIFKKSGSPYCIREYNKDGSYTETKINDSGKLVTTKSEDSGSGVVETASGKASATDISKILKDTVGFDGSDKHKYYHERLKEIETMLEGKSSDEIQKIIANMSESDFVNLSKIMNKGDAWFIAQTSDVGDDHKALLNKLLTPDLNYPENIDKMLTILDNIDTEKYGKKTYYENFVNMLSDKSNILDASDTQKQAVIKFLALGEKYYSNSGGLGALAIGLFVPQNSDGDIKASADSLYKSLECIDDLNSQIPENYKWSYSEKTNYWKSEMVNSLTKDDFVKIIQKEGSVDNAKKFLAELLGCEVEYLSSYLGNYSAFYTATKA